MAWFLLILVIISIILSIISLVITLRFYKNLAASYKIYEFLDRANIKIYEKYLREKLKKIKTSPLKTRF